MAEGGGMRYLRRTNKNSRLILLCIQQYVVFLLISKYASIECNVLLCVCLLRYKFRKRENCLLRNVRKKNKKKMKMEMNFGSIKKWKNGFQ